MKMKYLLYAGLLSVATTFTACINDDLNVDPYSLDESKAKPEWSLNASITNTQMNPHIAERIFILYWKQAANFDRAGGFARGADNNSWTSDYLSADFGAGWLRDANLAVNLAERKISAGEDNAYPYYRNVKQMARIWRAYLMAEMTQGVGPLPVLNAFQGENPPFSSEEAIYTYILEELKDAANSLDLTLDMSEYDTKLDLFYAGDASKWQKYGNSLRLRYAMLLTNIKPEVAKQHVEEVSKLPLITAATDIASVQEVTGWDPFTGVMSRSWNKQNMPVTFFNLAVGLGGQDFPVPATMTSQLKDATQYMGRQLFNNFPTTTNDPSAGYFFDGIPSKVDPRGPVLYHIVGYKDDNGVYPEVAFGVNGYNNPDYYKSIALTDLEGKNTVATINALYTWQTVVGGVWDKKGTSVSNFLSAPGNLAGTTLSSLSNKYRTSTNKRIFFAAWETYFLLAEAGARGWSVTGTTKTNYENGIAASFAYHGISDKLAAYLASKDYNRVGTSVSFDHTTEAVSHTVSYVDGYTGAAGTTTYQYPKNSIYNGGATNNDIMTKIFTQKYLAQMPYNALEVWSDHRRVGLPFFENPAVERDYDAQQQVPLTSATSKICDWKYYTKRYRYPSNWQTSDPKGYNQAVSLLGGADKTTTTLWWSK